MKKELKELLQDSMNILNSYYWTDRFEGFSEQSLENITLDTKEEVFKYQLKVYNELGIYIPFGIISHFIYECVTEFDCVWCGGNINIFGTVENFQNYLIILLKNTKITPQEAYNQVVK